MEQHLLVEIITEELPPKQVRLLGNFFPDTLFLRLQEAGFVSPSGKRVCDENDSPKCFATPRRFAALFEGIYKQSERKRYFRKGPQLSACKDASGAPTKALIGFMHSVGIHCENDLIEFEDNKKMYIAYEGWREGEDLEEVLSTMVEETLLSISAPRKMRWGEGDITFIRPIRGGVMMYGNQAMTDKTIMGAPLSAQTYGHPVLAPSFINLATAKEYEQTLKQDAYVIVDIQKREDELKRQFKKQFNLNFEELDNLTIKHSWGDETRFTFDFYKHFILEAITSCEYPKLYQGEFESTYLRLPHFCIERCLIHQQHALPDITGHSSHYYFVADNCPLNPDKMIAGYNAVLLARLRDLEFYINEDKKLTRENALLKLETMMYHPQLGSQGDRVRRLVKLAKVIAKHLDWEEDRISELCWMIETSLCDLPTQTIAEYPELEGLFAANLFCTDKKCAAFVQCLNDYSHTVFNNEKDNKMSAVLKLTLHMERLAGILALGEKLKGNKDPYGLRKTSFLVLVHLVQLGRQLSYQELADLAKSVFPTKLNLSSEEMAQFLMDRQRQILLDNHKKIKKVAVHAVSVSCFDFACDLDTKSHALSKMLDLVESTSLIELNKRINNLLRKSGEFVTQSIKPELFETEAEQKLYEKLLEVEKENAVFLSRFEFDQVLNNTLKIKEATDLFFDQVLVKAKAPDIRNNRLSLLLRSRDLLIAVGDLSKLST